MATCWNEGCPGRGYQGRKLYRSCRVWNSRLFKLLYKNMGSEHEAFLFHTNVRWLSKGNILGRLYELLEEVAIFLYSHQSADLHDKFQSEGFQLTLRTSSRRWMLSTLNYDGKTSTSSRITTLEPSWLNSISGNIKFSREIQPVLVTLILLPSTATLILS